MTTTNATIGEYVARTQHVDQVGTYTGSPATTRGAYVSGLSTDVHVGRYVQSAIRRTPGRAATRTARRSGAVLAHH